MTTATLLLGVTAWIGITILIWAFIAGATHKKWPHD